MNSGIFANRIAKVVLNPSENWKKCHFNEVNYKKEFRICFTIALSLVFVARIFGKTMTYLPSSSIQYILLYSLISTFVDLLCFICINFILYKIIPYYNIQASKLKVAILIFATLIPFYLSIIIANLFPSIFFLTIISLYGLYILYWGLVDYLKLKRKDLTVFYIITIILLVGLYTILHFVIIFPFFDFISQ